LHTRDPEDCPAWCVGRTGQPHDVDDNYGVMGTHHDSQIVTVELLGDDGSRLYVRASKLVPAEGDPWPTLVEIDADLSDVRRRNGPQSMWLYECEADAFAAAVTGAARLAE
jgi:hypothetical protein